MVMASELWPEQLVQFLQAHAAHDGPGRERVPVEVHSV
jgi:hypothetical protein